jgi:hypothetical protein
MTEDQARRVGELLVGLERLALDLGWRWNGERWVKPGEVLGARGEGRGGDDGGLVLCVDGV